MGHTEPHLGEGSRVVSNPHQARVSDVESVVTMGRNPARRNEVASQK
jgi:hypothetical protein